MTGLIEKDIRILAKQKKMAIIYVAVAFMLSFTMDSYFIVSYFTMIGAMLILSTLAYDSHENGFRFLMTLPIDAKTYVLGKLAFSFLGLGVFWIAAIVLQFIALTIQKIPFQVLDILKGDLLLLPVFLLTILMMIPMEIKFGPEKSRLVLFALCGVVLLAFFLGKQALTFLINTMHINVEGIIRGFASIPEAVIFIAAFAICALLTVISALISIRFMKNMEF